MTTQTQQTLINDLRTLLDDISGIMESATKMYRVYGLAFDDKLLALDKKAREMRQQYLSQEASKNGVPKSD